MEFPFGLGVALEQEKGGHFYMAALCKTNDYRSPMERMNGMSSSVIPPSSLA